MTALAPAASTDGDTAGRPAIETSTRRTLFDFSWLTTSVLLVYLSSANFGSHVTETDVMAAYAPASEFAHHGTFFMDRLNGHGPWMVHVAGHWAELRFPGTTLWAVPFYLVDRSQSSTPVAAPAAFAASLSAALVVGLVYILISRLAPRRTAVFAALVAAFATATWSVSADQLWEHGPGQMVLAAALVTLAADRLVIAGGFFGLALFVRPHLAIAALTVGLMLALTRRSLAPLVKVGVGCIPGTIAYFAYNRIMFATWSPLGGYNTSCAGQNCVNTGLHPLTFLDNLTGALISPGRGVLMYSPFLLLLLPGIRRSWREAADWIQACSLGGVLYLLTNFLLMDHIGDFYYGYRVPLETLTLAAPLLVLAYESWTARAAWRRRLLALLVIVSVVIQGVGAWPFIDPLVDTSPWTSSDLVHAVAGAGWFMTADLTVLVTATALLLIRRWRAPEALEHA